jgi:hypothetical protein
MKDIIFKTTSKFLGRNGEFKSTGLTIGETFENHVSIQPITSKGLIGKAIICIPKDSIDDLIKALLSIDGVGGNILIPVPDKEQKIKEIKMIIAEWGVVSIGELTFCESSPCISSIGNGKDNVSQLVEEFRLDYVQALTFIDEQELREDFINYEDLSNELIDEIYEIMVKHDRLMLENDDDN